MSATLLDDRAQRLAEVRAQAAAIADAPRPPRRFSVPAGTALRPSPRQRSRSRIPRPAAPRVHLRVRVPRRAIAGAVLLLQVALLVMALELPVFRVKTVTVTGTDLVSPSSVLAAAAVPRQSIFTIDTDGVAGRVEALPWVQSASVVTDLPATVRITVEERAPVIRLRRLDADSFIADTGAALPANPAMHALWAATPVLIDDRAGSPQPIDPSLLHILQTLSQRFPAVFGCRVAAYVWGVDGVFSVWASTGWSAVLGHIDTQDALAQVPAQLAALGDLRSQLNFAQPSFGYVRLDNPAGPAVGGTPGLPAIVQSSSLPLPSQFASVDTGAAANASTGPHMLPVHAPLLGMATAPPAPTLHPGASPAAAPGVHPPAAATAARSGGHFALSW